MKKKTKKSRKITKTDIGYSVGVAGGLTGAAGLVSGNPIITTSGAVVVFGSVGAMALDEYLEKRRAKKRKK